MKIARHRGDDVLERFNSGDNIPQLQSAFFSSLFTITSQPAVHAVVGVV